MLAKMGILGVLTLLAVTTGCTMCCHPYENCGPVYDGSACEPNCSTARAGSILEEEGEGAEIIPPAAPAEVNESPKLAPALSRNQATPKSRTVTVAESERKSNSASTASSMGDTSPARRTSKQSRRTDYSTTTSNQLR